MTEQIEQDVRERLALIESMMLEGRKTTEYWGWSFALWGVAYLVAIAWTYATGSAALPWSVTMVAAGVITGIVVSIRKRGHPETTKSRAIHAVWSATGAALFAFCFSAGISGHAEIHNFIGAIEIMLCIANFMSAAILRWSVQWVVGGIWWCAGVATFFLTPSNVWVLFIAAIIVCQIGFGIYLMVREAQARARIRAGQVRHA